MGASPGTSRIVMIRMIAALAPVTVVCALWAVDRWLAWVPTGDILQLTRSRSFEGLPTLSPDGEWIAYRNDATGNGDIYVRRIGGTGAINLTPDSDDNETEPAFSPDGALVAFTSSRSGLAIVRRDGGEIRRLAAGGGAPAWTPDGRYIVFSKDNAGDVRTGISEGWKIEVATGEMTRLVVGDFHAPSISPRGRRVAYWARPLDRFNRRQVAGSRGQIWTARLDGSDPHRVTADAANEWSPLWSPDGRYLYYISNRTGPSAVWRMRIDEETGYVRGKAVLVPTLGSQPTHLTRSADGRRFAWSDATPIQRAMRITFDADARTTRGAAIEVMAGDATWEAAEPSPDGSTIVLSSEEGHLHVTRAGALPTRLTSDRTLDRHPRWAPDGQSIVFQSNRAGNYSLWLMRSDGRGQRLLARASGDLRNPVWSPDGEQIAFLDSSLPATRLVRVGTEAAPSETLPPIPQGVFVPEDWSPDGKLIAGTVAGSVWFYSVTNRTYDQFRQGTNPVWLRDSRRLIYAFAGRLYMADGVLRISRELLALPEQQLDAPRLSRDNATLYFTGSATDANLWVMTIKQ